MVNLARQQHRIYKQRRKRDKRDSVERQFGGNYQEIEQDYYEIYQDYFYNLVVNLISYDNAPFTFDGRMLEFYLRNFGYARIAGVSINDVHVVGQNKDNQLAPAQGGFGFMTDSDYIIDVDGYTKLPLITRLNAERLDIGYTPIANKSSLYYNSIAGTLTDFQLVDRVAKTLAKIKATASYNLDQLKIPFIGFSNNKNLTAKNIYQNVQQGTPFIDVDASIGDLSKMLQIADINPNVYLQQLKEEWNNNLSEMLTMLGINTIGVDKRERLVASEADANDQLTEASGNIYLTARQESLDLINKVVGSTIKARYNQESVKNLTQLANFNPFTDAIATGVDTVKSNNTGVE